MARKIAKQTRGSNTVPKSTSLSKSMTNIRKVIDLASSIKVNLIYRIGEQFMNTELRNVKNYSLKDGELIISFNDGNFFYLPSKNVEFFMTSTQKDIKTTPDEEELPLFAATEDA